MRRNRDSNADQVCGKGGPDIGFDLGDRTIQVGDEKSGVSHVAIGPDGKTALVTRDGDHIAELFKKF